MVIFAAKKEEGKAKGKGLMLPQLPALRCGSAISRMAGIRNFGEVSDFDAYRTNQMTLYL